MANNNVNKSVREILNNCSKKNTLFLFYYIIIFLLFGSLSVFDIIVNFIGEKPEISVINLTFGVIFGIIALISLIYTVIFLFKPKQILEISLANKTFKINYPFGKSRTLNFNEIYFFKTNDDSFLGMIFKYSSLKVYTKNAECLKVSYLNDSSKLIKQILEAKIGIKERNIYDKNGIKVFFIRIYQYMLKFAMLFVHHKEAKLLTSYNDIGNVLKEKGINKVLIVESATIAKKNLHTSLLNSLKSHDIQFIEFNDVAPNPTIENCINGKNIFISEKAQAIIAIGGGSPIDCAKGIALSAYSKKAIRKYKGVFKIHHKVPLLIAIPTTCGTGSETTFVTVLTDKETHEKFEITSNKITPKYALLDEKLLSELPLHFIASTSLDAFSHALESYLNLTHKHKSKKYSLEAMKLIYENLAKVKGDPSNLIYKKKLLYASFLAGKAFTIGLVGPIHALAHALGGKYDLGHGYLNAILLPRFLNVYAFDCYKELSEISNYIGLSNTKNIYQDSVELIKYLQEINLLFNFKQDLDMIKNEDIKTIAKKAYKESHLLYPSKHFVSVEMYEDILISLMKK